MIDALTTLLSSQMMQRSLLAALIVGLTAPIIGTYLVHRRLAMLGDGIGHISLTGVALGWLAGTFANVSPADSWAIPGAVIISCDEPLKFEPIEPGSALGVGMFTFIIAGSMISPAT